ncbi:DUF4102 domain-containing protein [Chitinimonas arctica]|uniref:DUF4102 domain-containing protein n=1 Tax=Chitinimonas arctica TaxID=2594795 RepID=A0A516SAT8_9NEIS|nr:integrase arm-type DNA-binding domain-containing protein [Chitinimonas arctica]QDQ25262.1 DUF4102 domain-containing protein [Chitinimonas arctica]
MPLTEMKCRNTKPEEKPIALQDGNGLYLEVRPSGKKVWLYRYWLTPKKAGRYTIGEYPAVSLVDARRERERVRGLVAQGINPTEARNQAKLIQRSDRSVTLRKVANDWITYSTPHWKPNTLRQVNTFLERDLLATYGALPIGEITSAHILTAIRKVEERGAKSIAVLVRQWAGGIFRHAIANLIVDIDPTYALRGSIRMPTVKHHAHLEAPDVGPFLVALDAYQGYGLTNIATNLLLLTLVRTTELRLAKWTEFDLEAAEWRIPVERMKMGRPHIVPLSRQAVEKLRMLHKFTGERNFLFPNMRRPNEGMTNTTILRVIECIGYKGKVTGHGFRGTGTTVLHENGFPEHVIERQLAHTERNQVKAAYNHAQYLPERREMLQWWADWIDAQRPMPNVVQVSAVETA